MNFVFVILHYKSYEDTLKCISTIFKLSNEFKIVVVDNASGDGSIDIIRDKYGDKIYIIENEKNLGFADGNNVGYEFAKKKLEAEFIIMCNSDIIFDQKDFLKRVEKTYIETSAHIIGPDIESLLNYSHQNPMSGTSTSLTHINKEIIRYAILLFFSKIHLYDYIKKKRKKKYSESYVSEKHGYQQDVTLHGSILIFTPKFISEEDQAFRSGTFLYMEEDILYIYSKYKHYTMLYAPKLHVYHKEDSSTDTMVTSKKRKREFVFRNMIHSMMVYKKYVKKYL